MIRLAHTELEPEAAADESVTVAAAARRLGCATSTVRELLEAGELRGHRVGKHRGGKAPRGVRVKLSSVADYERRNAIGRTPKAANDAAPPPRVVHSPGAAEARRRLRALGVL